MTREEQWLLAEGFGGEKSEAFFTALSRLRAGEPLAYLIGHIPFLGATIYLDNQPLIPRTETEFWVEKAIKEMRLQSPSNILSPDTHRRFPASGVLCSADFPSGTDQAKSACARPISSMCEGAEVAQRVLDLCAGSGAIGVAVAKAVPEASVDFAEIDARLLPTIQKNCTANDIAPDRTTIIESDLFFHIDSTYDFILSNPPYIDPVLDRTEVSVKHHEPHLALYGGVSGMEIIERIIRGARASLAPRGQLWIEHEPEQANLIASRAAQQGFSTTSHKDQYDIVRYSILVLQ